MGLRNFIKAYRFIVSFCLYSLSYILDLIKNECKQSTQLQILNYKLIMLKEHVYIDRNILQL